MSAVMMASCEKRDTLLKIMEEVDSDGEAGEVMNWSAR